MGTRLAEYFDKVKEIGGLSCQVKLAMITKMSAKQALAADDNAANIQVFEKALAQIKLSPN
ncbi:MAG: hypothetical protein GX631_06260 [Dehalococcoidales bacterium]|jgi:hypothetical protein|nr:hypothetical protein [Dehalococcoidales bacterium]